MTGVVRRAAGVVFAAALAVVAAGHVGSPNVFFAGKAGPYDVSVVVRPPSVVPGVAEITVRIPAGQADGVHRVDVRPVYWQTGTRGSPAADAATRADAPEPTWAGRLWLMSRGSYSVHVTVEGTRGSGTAIVPVAAVATARLTLGRGLTALLVVLGAVLLAGLVTIARAAAGDTLLAPGETASPALARRRRIVTAVTIPVLALAVLGGWRWWTGEARDYARTLYRPLAVTATVRDEQGARHIALEVTDSAWRARNIARVIPDHGKLMHMFVVRDSTLDVFAHLHPAMRDENTFDALLPSLPAGRYRVYGDVVHESGFERTLVSVVDVPPAAAAARPAASGSFSEGDDAWTIGERAAIAEAAAARARLADGSILTWHTDGAPLVAGRETTLRFDVADSAGRPLPLEPYLGMSAHAVVMRDDGSVFIHLHPMGTVTAAAQQAFALRDRGDTTASGRLNLADTAGVAAGMPVMGGMQTDSRFSFPYAFPRSGRYRMWVQVKRDGRVLTGAFEARVADTR